MVLLQEECVIREENTNIHIQLYILNELTYHNLAEIRNGYIYIYIYIYIYEGEDFLGCDPVSRADVSK